MKNIIYKIRVTLVQIQKCNLIKLTDWTVTEETQTFTQTFWGRSKLLSNGRWFLEDDEVIKKIINSNYNIRNKKFNCVKKGIWLLLLRIKFLLIYQFNFIVMSRAYSSKGLNKCLELLIEKQKYFFFFKTVDVIKIED